MNVDNVGEVMYWGSFFLLPLTFIVSIMYFYRVPMLKRMLAAACFAISISVAVFIMGIGICFRDGLGPDSADTSSGWLAIWRSRDGLVGLLPALVLMPIGIILVRVKGRFFAEDKELP